MIQKNVIHLNDLTKLRSSLFISDKITCFTKIVSLGAYQINIIK